MAYLGNQVAPLVQALEGKELKLDSDGDSSITADTDDQIDFKTGGSDRLTIDSSGNVGIGTSSPSQQLHLSGSTPIVRLTDTDTNAYGEISSSSSDGNLMFFADQGNTQANTTIRFSVDASERMRIDTSGNLLVGKTAQNHTDVGHTLYPTGGISIVRDGSQCAVLNRLSSDGTIIDLRKGGTTIGVIKVENGNNLRVAGKETDHAGLEFGTQNIFPVRSDALSDNGVDLGASSNRFDDVFATNGTIQTSDQNEKQDIASVTAKELNVAKKLSSLFKTFRWKDKVIEKGEKARTHTGIIAQEIQSAFSAEGLDASKYGLFTSDTWWEKQISVDAVEANEEKGIEAKDAYTYMDTKDEKTDGYTERTRLGVRYPELFSFIFSSIEARLTALESK